MKLINGVALGYAEPDNSVHEIINIEKRLQLLYPGKYELKRYVENEIYIVLLKINLSEKFDLTIACIQSYKRTYIKNRLCHSLKK